MKLNVKNLCRSRPKEDEPTSPAKETEATPEVGSTCSVISRNGDGNKSPNQPTETVKRRIPEPGWEEDELYE